ncbi:MAG: hypothetical protein E7184_02115 [Erysipelotrichaceae bacterium]|nr:hypothetical protein [Erysipelotrichaceae bacterium]
MEDLFINAVKVRDIDSNIFKIKGEYFQIENAIEDKSINDNYAYFNVLPESSKWNHLVYNKDENGKLTKVKTQIKIPKDLYQQKMVLVGRRINGLRGYSKPLVINKFGYMEVEEDEVVTVITPYAAITEKKLQKEKIGFYLKDLKDGSIVEEVIPSAYIPGRRICLNYDNKGQPLVQIGVPDNPLHKGYNYTFDEVNEIILQGIKNKGRN